jgi:hypothetical protein
MGAQTTGLPWYRYPIMWLVVAPPVGAVIAGIITMILILQHPDRDVRTAHATTAVIQGHASNSVVPPAE